jgi:hypothetical protein
MFRGLCCALLVLVAGCGSQAPAEKKEPSGEVLDAKSAEAVSKLAAKHNACADWWGSLRNETPLPGAYTIELQEAWVRSDGRPVVIVGRVEDIFRKEKAIFLKIPYRPVEVGPFKFPDLGPFAPSVQFVLECSEDCANAILTEARTGKHGVHAFVCSISQIERHATGAEASDSAVAIGRCLEAVPLGVEP